MMDINVGLLQWSIIFLIKSRVSNQKLAEEFHKPIIRNFEKRKV